MPVILNPVIAARNQCTLDLKMRIISYIVFLAFCCGGTLAVQCTFQGQTETCGEDQVCGLCPLLCIPCSRYGEVASKICPYGGGGQDKKKCVTRDGFVLPEKPEAPENAKLICEFKGETKVCGDDEVCGLCPLLCIPCAKYGEIANGLCPYGGGGKDKTKCITLDGFVLPEKPATDVIPWYNVK